MSSQSNKIFILFCTDKDSVSKKRKTRHRPNKFESAVQSFKEVLTGQHEENVKVTNSIQQQWLELEKQRVQNEMEERERERQHELRMMELFSTMVQQVPQPQLRMTSSSQHQPTYTDLTHSTPPTNNYFPNYNFQ